MITEPRLADHNAIATLMTGWIYRDISDWHSLAGLFHDDGEIEITWYEGNYKGFIEGSKKMGDSALKTNHLVTSPIITFNGDRALVETKAMISADNLELNLGSTTHNRFFDYVEKRGGVWGIVKRQSIYDMSWFTFPTGFKDINADSVAQHPREYASLAYLLAESGFPVARTFATRGSDAERNIRRAGQDWLNS